MRRRRVLQLGAAAMVATAACTPETTDRRQYVAVSVGLPDHPIGFADHLLRAAGTPPSYLLWTEAGVLFALGLPPDDRPFTITLSPSGRWLGWSTGAAFDLRDLTGREVRRFTGESEIMGAWWSASGRWLLLAENRYDTWTMIDLEGGAVSRPTGIGGDVVVGLSPEGRVLLAEVGQSSDDPRRGFATFRWFDPSSGQSGPSVTAHSQSDLVYPGHWPVLGPDATTAIVPYFTATSTLDPYFATGPLTALVEVDLADGHEVAARALDPAEQWTLRAGWVDGVTVTRRREGVQELVRLSDPGADPVVLGQFGLDAEVTPRGTTTH